MFYINDKVNRNILVSCDHGLMIVNRFDCNHDQVGHGQWLLDHGNTSTVEAQKCYDAIKHKKQPIIFDVGANIGTFTTWMSRIFPNGKIYSFEPQRAVFQMLCGNVAINNMYNCYCYNKGLGKENTTIAINEPNYFSKNDFGVFSLIEEKIESTQDRLIIDIETLDSFVHKYQIQKLDLIKIDAEGMDMDVLIGGSRTLIEMKPVIFIEHSDNRSSIKEKIISYLNEENYYFEQVGNNLLATPVF